MVQRPTHIFAVATVLLITKTDRERERGGETGGQTERQKQRDRQRQ